MPKVITYRYAYTRDTVDLCEQHQDSYEYPLGQVKHGLHNGTCDVCESIVDTRQRILDAAEDAYERDLSEER